jgi:prevent-host-death family protein
MKISAKEARDRFSEVVNRAAFGKERVVVTKNGKPVAALVPIEDLEALEATREARFRAAMEDTLERYDEVFRRLAE